jgi:DNA-directed RNA polymerase subunit RPC12/RpoP
MFIEVKQNIKCSKCGSTDYESFSDRQYQGMRCKACGHEKKSPHPHLTATESSGTSWVSSGNRDIEF